MSVCAPSRGRRAARPARGIIGGVRRRHRARENDPRDGPTGTRIAAVMMRLMLLTPLVGDSVTITHSYPCLSSVQCVERRLSRGGVRVGLCRLCAARSALRHVPGLPPVVRRSKETAEKAHTSIKKPLLWVKDGSVCCHPCRQRHGSAPTRLGGRDAPTRMMLSTQFHSCPSLRERYPIRSPDCVGALCPAAWRVRRPAFPSSPSPPVSPLPPLPLASALWSRALPL